MTVAKGLVVALLLAPCAAWPQGMPLGPEFRVNSYTPGYQQAASVASDASGNFVVVWQSFGQDGAGWGVFGQRYDSAGATLGTEFRVNTYTTDAQSDPFVTSDPSGNFVVVWQSYSQDGSTNGVFAQRYAGSGTPLGGEFRVNSYTTGQQFHPSIASDSSGGFVVAWGGRTLDDSDYGVFAQRYDTAGALLGTEFRVNTYTTSSQYNVSVASDASGNFVVVWQSYTQDGSFSGIVGQRFGSTGAPLGSEFRVNTYTTSYQTFPTVSSDSSGDFVIAWTSLTQDGSGNGVFGQRYDSSGAPEGAEFRVNTYTADAQRRPFVTSDSSGAFVVVWQSATQDGSSYGVFGQRYDSAGTPQGTEFLVNSYTTNQQTYPSAASDSAGDFIVVWDRSGQIGQLDGVFAQRYSPIVPVELTGFAVE